MYRHCIYCSADLGTNQTLEAFPVGGTVAFDAERGRLWAVCRRCSRWNLAPLEERWEAVEDAERRFAASRLRVQAGSIGVAAAPDGTRLVRVGPALTQELAAWRYGAELRRRHRWFLPPAVAGATGAVWRFLPLAMNVLGPAGLGAAALFGALHYAGGRRTVIRLSAEESPTGEPLVLRGVHMAGAMVRRGRGPGELKVDVPLEGVWGRLNGGGSSPVVTLEGNAARRTIERAMPLVNALGGSRAQVRQAVEKLQAHVSADALLDDVARFGVRLRVPMVTDSERTGGPPLTGARALAFEMALHDEAERRALHGELKLLESAWREAEEIAAIADRLVLPGG